MFGLKIILFLILLSGFIAYSGDLIGRKIGKKRLTLFNLRPRYTAIFITILSGIFISLFTLSVIIIISKEARDALFKTDIIKKNLEEAKKELKEKTLEIEKIKEILQQTKEKKKKLEEEYFQTKTRLNLTENKKEELEKKISELNNKKQNLIEKIESLRKQGEHLFEKLKEARKELEEVKFKKLIFKADQEILRISIPKKIGEKEIENIIMETLKEVNKIVLLKSGKFGKEERGIVVYQFQIDDLIKNIKNREESLILRILSAENTVEGEPVFLKFELYIDKLIFKAGEIIIEEIIPSLNSEREIENALSNILQKVREIALKKGILMNPEGNVGEISAIKFYNTVEKIKKLKKEVVLKVISKKNIYRGEQLDIDFIIEDGN
jgi:uncharacterized protein (DUF3084 family)